MKQSYTTYHCSACGALMRYTDDFKRMRCLNPDCRREYDIEEVMNLKGAKECSLWDLR